MRLLMYASLYLIAASVCSGCSTLAPAACEHFGILPPPRFEPACCDATWGTTLGGRHGKGGCGGKCAAHDPVAHLKDVLTCGSGCSEVYWGPWISDPPAPCDPCDDCGNWIGPRECGPTHWEYFTASAGDLFGSRAAGYGPSKGCSSCVAGGKGGGKGFISELFESDPYDMPGVEGPIMAPPQPAAEELPPAAPAVPREDGGERTVRWQLPRLLPVSARSGGLQSGRQ